MKSFREKNITTVKLVSSYIKLPDLWKHYVLAKLGGATQTDKEFISELVEIEEMINKGEMSEELYESLERVHHIISEAENEIN